MPTTLEKGVIVHEGMGGFLCPPTHPEHSYHVQTDLRRRPWNRGGMSLSYAVNCDYLEPSTRHAAKRKLESWNRPPLESAEIQAWIRQVLGYYAGCYKGEQEPPKCWEVANLRIDKALDPVANADTHAGVNMIRQYYPEFSPTKEHFAEAKWA